MRKDIHRPRFPVARWRATRRRTACRQTAASCNAFLRACRRRPDGSRRDNSACPRFHGGTIRRTFAAPLPHRGNFRAANSPMSSWPSPSDASIITARHKLEAALAPLVQDGERRQRRAGARFRGHRLHQQRRPAHPDDHRERAARVRTPGSRSRTCSPLSRRSSPSAASTASSACSRRYAPPSSSFQRAALAAFDAAQPPTAR